MYGFVQHYKKKNDGRAQGRRTFRVTVPSGS